MPNGAKLKPLREQRGSILAPFRGGSFSGQEFLNLSPINFEWHTFFDSYFNLFAYFSAS